MGFFKDFKDDLSKAVNELLPDTDDNMDDMSDMVNTLDSEMVNTLDSEEPASDESETEMKEWLEEFAGEVTDEENVKASEDETENELNENAWDDDIKNNENKEEVMEDGVGDMEENIDLELLDALNAEEEKENKEKDTKENMEKEKKVRAASVIEDDEVTVISKGTNIDGNISSNGSLEIMGNVTGDVECLGKLTITGKIIGNATAAEVYVNTERLEGSINSEGSVKIGLGTVVIGDITGTSAVIAGAVKGEIDVNGPVVIDSTAIIKGNIKAKSLQINNGAVIEGFCSLTYSDVSLDNVFE